MEDKLYRAAAALPEPKMDYQALEAMRKHEKPRWRISPRRRAVIVMALAVCLIVAACTHVAEQYGRWYLASSRAYSDLENVAERYGVALPESLGGTPFLEYTIYGLVPKDAPWAAALLNPSYKPRSVDYGWRMREHHLDSDGEWNGGVTSWNEIDLRLNFGTTENDLWRYYFEYDESGVWTACEVPESYEVIEYKGITLQVGDTFFYDEALGCNRYTRWVHWVDEEKQVAFSLHEKDYTDPDRVVECAKAIIDLNS